MEKTLARTPINDPTPQVRAGGKTRIAGTLVIAALVIAIILLALDVIQFDPAAWFD